MKINPDIEPQLNFAEKNYSQTLSILTDYEKFVDEHGDENNQRYSQIETLLHEMTGKDMSQYNLYEAWEAEGVEVLAFRISLPYPNKVDNITYTDVYEIVRRLKTPFFEDADYKNDASFVSIFTPYLDDYYHHFLKLNLRKYKYSYFLRQSDGTEFSIEEIVNQIIE